MDLYQSKIGEIKSKDQWLAWLDQFYERLGLNDEAIKISRPDDGWEAGCEARAPITRR